MLLKTKINTEHFGITETVIPKCSDLQLKKAFKSFLLEPETYRKEFLQTRYACAFDGYSYLGQKDSANQYDTDLLHSFVLSKFSARNTFPQEFQSFLNNDWDALMLKIKQIELAIIDQLNIPGLKEFYDKNIGHMVSCNYYPPVDLNQNTIETRLSKHVDVSLFTVFVFGAREGFSYENSLNEKVNLRVTDNIVFFPGYLLEFLTNGKYKALQHEVDFSGNNEERYSFAFFSIPKPLQTITCNDLQFTSESYYESYLSLF